MASVRDTRGGENNGNVGENGEEAEGVPDLFREKIREAAGKGNYVQQTPASLYVLM